MINYDTTQIAILVSLVFTIAAIGTALALGVLVRALILSWRTRPALPKSQLKFPGRLAFHH